MSPDAWIECNLQRKKNNFFFKVLPKAFLSLFIYYGIRSCLGDKVVESVEPAINNSIRDANNALEKFENISGEGPFLRHILHKNEVVLLDYSLLLYPISGILNFLIFYPLATLNNEFYSLRIMLYVGMSAVLNIYSIVLSSYINSHIPFDIYNFILWFFFVV